MTPALKRYAVTYQGKRPRSSAVETMTARIWATDPDDARRVFYQTRSHRHQIQSIKED